MKIFNLVSVTCLGVLLVAGRTEATPVTITQIYGPVLTPIVVNGAAPQLVTGDWIFTILTDTTNPDLEPSTTIGRFAASAVVSNTGLGLVNVGVTNLPFYYEWDTRAAGLINQSWSSAIVMYGVDGVVGDSNVIELGALDFTAVNQRAFSVHPMILADGTTIEAHVELGPGSQSGSNSGQTSIASAPEPASLILLATGVAGVLIFHRRTHSR